MKRILVAFGGIAVALAAVPAGAKHYSPYMECRKWHKGDCVKWTRLTRAQARYKIGYVFGPKYVYTDMADIPQPVVTQYSLSADSRYVYTGHEIYVVDPSTYAVTKVIVTTP